ncbi:polysaccharide biosynthesis protein [Fundicoccus culcitae]|uniref:Polysaccharide biosynthesis protein n=1 Tax=Fundicoccus culcitae TaxID=2969821 RepID=A0ABY5P926_9LACT|nr:nucleoside-diphosphate sugar epimerase/dehydratase [Fundicoccus culcitae]UUX35252.1 polysaccharide biosynthesis protein [Fundicoccus culcitae]
MGKYPSTPNLFVEFIEKLTPRQKSIIWFFIDLTLFSIGTIIAYLLYVPIVDLSIRQLFISMLIAYCIYLVCNIFYTTSSTIHRYNGIVDFVKLFLMTSLSWFIAGLSTYFIFDIISYRFILLAAITTSVLIVACRILWYIIYTRSQLHYTNRENHRVILIGAGDGGSLFMQNYRRGSGTLNVVAILDDNPAKHHQKIGGVAVLGDLSKLHQVITDYEADRVVIAIPSLEPEKYERIIQLCNEENIDVYKMPEVENVLLGVHQGTLPIKEIEIADLLGREEIILDEKPLKEELEGKVIAITGAGGSIGSEIARQVSRFNPKKVILIGHGENSIYLIHGELINNRLSQIQYVPLIADIQDYDRILNIFQQEQPDIVYHAAAHKHVPLMELNPTEALKNNIYGTYNVAKAVNAAKVGKMVMISTDKAVNPPNVMGASKRIAELIVTGFDQISHSTYCAVRFGNVLGSRGSVIPLFKKQIANGGPVTVTDFEMTRYFMTIPEASRLVIHAGTFAKGGEVFVLDMSEPVKILDLAKKMILLSGYSIEEIGIVEIGKRPGEKLYEELISSNETTERRVNEKIIVGKVLTLPLAEIQAFIAELDSTPQKDLKNKIIAFANKTTQSGL